VRNLGAVAFMMLSLVTLVFAQETQGRLDNQGAARSPLDARIARFDLTDAILRDCLSELSLKNIGGLHLGFEEIIRGKIQDDPRNLNPHFSLHLRDRSVREVLDALCESDARYIWTQDAASINVYPQMTIRDSAYLLNLRIDRLAVQAIPDPDQGLTPLSKMFPNQQIGYFGSGLGDNTYEGPWTTVFELLTVRQFINRLAEHMGPRTSWVWEGGRDERMFTFLKGGFNTSRP
jgi:hypothetical protein